MPPTAWSSRYCVRAEDGSPKRSESSTAIGRAPIAKMSRRMPPPPVAGPGNGPPPAGDREGAPRPRADAGRGARERRGRRRVVVRLDLEGDHPAVAGVDRAGVLAGP